ncbi:MAG: exodeoxyribonuclease III [candidate division Zixibacteria bacterium]|jgi:exodeoxyribonuclease-3|nr:exodeoxyribonuclease III [candidate division Zixibacteria bacterium]
MKIITWNVNSIRSRLARLLAVLERHQPDIVCLQELKTIEDNFPRDEISSAGYHAAVFGQKTYNGVALLSKSEPGDIRRGFDDGSDDPQARLISADIDGVRVICGYFPNGGTVGSEKWEYKLDWMKRLRAKLDRDFDPSQLLLLCGDTNVAIDDSDVANPVSWADSVLCAPPARDALARICDWGLVDVFRRKSPDGGVYSWWDYRQLAFPKNDGLRIDHILATASLAKTCVASQIDRDERKGQQPSDHAPVIAVFE